MKPGQIYWLSIYGKLVRCRVIKVHPFGTYDVERIFDGRCFRVTGLS